VTGPAGFPPSRHPTPTLQRAAPAVANPYPGQVAAPQYPPAAYGPPNGGGAPTGPQPGRASTPTGTQPPPAMQTGQHKVHPLTTGPTPAHAINPQGVPPAAPSSVRGGTMPSLPAAQQQHSQQGQQPSTMYRHHTGATPAAPARITVQYPQVGSTLKGQRGSYFVRDTIGSGEFGAVYECIGPFDQIYALKMVRPSNRPYSEVQAEWAREQSRLFSLRHPNVVYIYDSFEHDHLFYLALERCDHDLKAMLGTPMQEGLVLEMTRQLLAAVQFLHDNEVVHDDLHAGNVLITHTDRPTVKISDFGISNELRGMTAVRPNVVHHAIMAPEILATGYTSRQSDLYQVGLLLYWMLTGEPAIQMAVPYQELVRQVADGEPRRRAEQLGTPFGDLIAKMLRRREAFRYASAREVWAELRELPAWKQRNLFPVK
jgi:eukaryotic-like serine/threonine-protein kinase